MGGLAVGAASIVCPAYISEIAPSAVRGRLASLQQLAIVLGLFFAFLSNYLFAGAAGTAGSLFWFGFQAWQWMFWAEIIPAAVFFLGLIFIPESPRYLVAAHRPETARTVLGRLGHPDPDKKVREIQETLRTGHKPRMSDLYDPVIKKIRPILWVGIGLATFQQLVGINVVFYYGEILWRAAGFSEGNALLQNVISGAVNIGSTFVAIALVDKLGRKPLLIFGSIGMTFSLGALAWMFGSSPLDEHGKLALAGSAGLSALIAANAYIFCFGVSWGPVMWVMLGEMFQNQFRGAALSVSGFVQWMSNFAITMTFPILLGSFGLGGAYGLYTVFAAVSIVFVLKLVHETKGKVLEEM
jgi:SP family sugar:H+ symporter-like MFS transporter